MKHQGQQPDSERPSNIDNVILSFLDAIDRGERQDIESWVTRFPHYADDLRRFAEHNAMLRGDLRSNLAPSESEFSHESQDDSTPTQSTHGFPKSFAGYLLDQPVGEGGMGIVFRARHESLERWVAIKFVKSAYLTSSEHSSRFRNEAKAAAQLQHPNIVSVFDFGEHDGRHFLVMDYVRGTNLAEYAAGEAILPAVAAQHLLTIAGAIHYAHSKGVIHRDLKPDNILVDERLCLRVTDFGLAKRIDEGDMTQTGQIVGSPGYMAPEQANSNDFGATTPKTDVYGLGGLLYSMLTGQPPFSGPSMLETVWKVMHSEPTSIRRLNPSVPIDLESICLRCLEKQPSARYESVSELMADLSRFLDGKPVAARPVRWYRRNAKWVRRRPVITTLAILVLCTAFFSFAYSRWQRSHFDAQMKQQTSRAKSLQNTVSQVTEERDEATYQAQFEATNLYLDRAESAFKTGTVDIGLNWLVHALDTLPTDAQELDQLIRANLVAWFQQMPRLQSKVPHKSHVLQLRTNRRGDRFVTRDLPRTITVWHSHTVGSHALFRHVIRSGRIIGFDVDDESVRLFSAETRRDAFSELMFLRRDGVTKTGFRLHSAKEIVFIPRQTLVCVRLESSLQTWDYATQKLVVEKPFPDASKVRVMAAHPHKTALLMVVGHDAFWIDPLSLETIRDINIEWNRWGTRPTRAAISQDGGCFALARGKNLQAFRFPDCQKLGAQISVNANVESIAIDGDDSVLAVSSEDRSVIALNPVTGEVLSPRLVHSANARAMRFLRRERVPRLAVAADDSVNIWHVNTYQPWLVLNHGISNSQTALRFSRQQIVAVGGQNDRAIRAFSLDGEPLEKTCKYDDYASCWLIHPDGQRAVSCRMNEHRKDGSTKHNVEGHDLIQQWDLDNGAAIGEPIRVDDMVVLDMAINTLGSHLVLVGFTTLPSTGEGNGTLRKLSFQGAVQLWDLEHRRQISSKISTLNRPNIVAISSQGDTLLAGGQKIATLIHLSSGVPSINQLRHEDDVSAVSVSADGRFGAIATIAGEVIRWDLATQTIIGNPMRHGSPVTELAFSHDGRILAVGTDDGHVRLWDVATSRSIGPKLKHRGRVQHLSFFPSGQHLSVSVGLQTVIHRIPQPAIGTGAQLKSFVKSSTGQSVTKSGVRHTLSASEWLEVHRNLNGFDPMTRFKGEFTARPNKVSDETNDESLAKAADDETPSPDPRSPAKTEPSSSRMEVVYNSFEVKGVVVKTGSAPDVRLIRAQVVNASGRIVRVPANQALGKARFDIGDIQFWIERLGADPSIPRRRQMSRQANRYPNGGRVLRVNGPLVASDQAVYQSNVKLDTSEFPPGEYRVHVEYRELDHKRVYSTATCDFSVPDPSLPQRPNSSK